MKAYQRSKTGRREETYKMRKRESKAEDMDIRGNGRTRKTGRGEERHERRKGEDKEEDTETRIFGKTSEK